MSTLIRSSILVGIGIILWFSGEKFTYIFKYLPINAAGSIILFQFFGIILIFVGILLFLFSVLMKPITKKEGKKVEEIYICHFCKDKFRSEEELDAHIAKNHKELIEDKKKMGDALGEG